MKRFVAGALLGAAGAVVAGPADHVLGTRVEPGGSRSASSGWRCRAGAPS
jgi:hypothetical protein